MSKKDLFTGNKKDVQKMNKAFQRALKSDVAKSEALDFLVDSDYQVEINSSGGSSRCSVEDKKISLSSKLNDDELVFAITHEAAHAKQYGAGFDKYSDVYKNNIKSQVMSVRIMEAAANVVACASAFELNEKGDKNVLKEFEKTFDYISEPFKKAKSENKNPYMEAFKGWYDNSEVKLSYENIGQVTKLVFSNPENFSFSQEISPKELVEKACNIKGENYFDEKPEILETGKYADMSYKTKNHLDDYMETRRKPLGLKIDESYLLLPTRKEKQQASKNLTLEEKKQQAKERIAELKKKKQQKDALKKAKDNKLSR